MGRRRSLSSTIDSRGCIDEHMRACLQAILIAGDDALVERETGIDDGQAGAFIADLQCPDLDGGIAFHHVGEGAVGPELHRGGGQGEHVARSAQQHARVDELPGPESVVRIGEDRFQLGRAGRLIDLVIDQRESALIQFAVPIARQGRDLHRSYGKSSADGGQVFLGQREDHRDRLDLRHHHDARSGCRMHDIARVHQA